MVGVDIQHGRVGIHIILGAHCLEVMGCDGVAKAAAAEVAPDPQTVVTLSTEYVNVVVTGTHRAELVLRLALQFCDMGNTPRLVGVALEQVVIYLNLVVAPDPKGDIGLDFVGQFHQPLTAHV